MRRQKRADRLTIWHDESTTLIHTDWMANGSVIPSPLRWQVHYLVSPKTCWWIRRHHGSLSPLVNVNHVTDDVWYMLISVKHGFVTSSWAITRYQMTLSSPVQTSSKPAEFRFLKVILAEIIIRQNSFYLNRQRIITLPAKYYEIRQFIYIYIYIYIYIWTTQ